VPIHDWTRVDAGLFHAFHQSWIVKLCDALNRGLLPSEYFALPEQSIRGPIPDVLTSRLLSEEAIYVRKADRISVRHVRGSIVAVVEVVSPGNKGDRNELRTFVEKTSDLIEKGIHLLVVDLFPPTELNPCGIHKAIWDEFAEADFNLPAGKPLSLAAYEAGPPLVAYVEPVAVGEELPEMPLFLKPDFYVPAPLEASYELTWSDFPAPMKRLLETPPEDSPENA
jgi:hypothetical protein